MLAKDVRPSLFLLRLGIFAVMAVWAGDKFFRPEHTAAVFEHFYMLPVITPTVSYVIGAVQALIAVAFLFGVRKKWSYGLVLFMHTVATFTSWRQYLQPYEDANILFFAAWPMWAAILTLYALRDQDTLMTVRR